MIARTDGGKLLVVALIASLAAHVALMATIRPRVLTQYGEYVRPAPARPSRISHERKPPDFVPATQIGDLAALRDAPAAEPDRDVPQSGALANSAIPETVAPPPDLGRIEAAERPVFEVAPKLAEKIAVAEAAASAATPLVSGGGLLGAPLSTVPAPALPAQPVATTLPVPSFPAPDILPDVDLPATPAPVRELSSAVSSAENFVPKSEVMDELDESVVAAEKQAVSDLIETRDVRELEQFVAVTAGSAKAGEWNYFKIDIAPLDSLKPVPKDVVVLIDASGSIANDRLRSCRAAAKELLRAGMNSGDRFNLVAFRNDFEYAFRAWQPCNRDSFAKADRWMDNLAAHGRTDVFSSIASVLKLPRDPKRPLIALVVTDGDANSGLKDTSRILSRFTALNDGLVSIYMYGVKATANRELISLLTRGNRGDSYVWEGDRKAAGARIGDLAGHFRDPALSDLRVIFSAGTPAEAYPRRLRNLYCGDKVEIIGRVRQGVDKVAFAVRGLNGAKAYEGFFRINLAAAGYDSSLPKRWHEEADIDARLQP